MNNRDLSQKVRVIVILTSVVIMLAACQIEEEPPEILHVTAVSSVETGELRLSVYDPKTLQPIVSWQTEMSVPLDYDAESESYSCLIEKPQEDAYVLYVTSEDQSVFGVVESLEQEDGNVFIEVRRSYSIGDRGPTGGLISREYPLDVYLETGVRYLEAAPEESSGSDLKHAEGVDYCNQLVFAGADDWSMPTVAELDAVSEVLSGTEESSLVCWSSEQVDDYSYLAYTMADGETSPHSGVTRHTVWPVRSF